MSVGSTLAISIGALAVVAGYVDAVLLRPLPFAEPSRLVLLANPKPSPTEQEEGARRGAAFLIPEVAEWAERVRLFEDIEAFSTTRYVLDTSNASMLVTAAIATPGLLDLLGSPPSSGRYWAPGETHQAVAVVSPRVWRLLGPERSITLNGSPFVATGALPRRFPLIDAEVIVPMDAGIRLGSPEFRARGLFTVVARVKSGVAIADAQLEATAVDADVAALMPVGRHGALVVPLQEALSGSKRVGVWVLAMAAIWLYLTAVANATNLAMARAINRRSEFAVRNALGATGRQVIALAVGEGAVLAATGIGLGLIFASAGQQLFSAWRPAGEAITVEIGWVSLMVALAAGSFATLALSTVVGFVMTRSDRSLLFGSYGGAEPRALVRVRHLLVGIQVALAVASGAGAVVFVKTFVALQARDPGIDAGAALVMQLSFLPADHATPDAQRRVGSEIVNAIRRVPGVRTVGIGTALPPNRSYGELSTVIVDQRTGQERRISMDLVAVSPGYLQAIGARLREGRLFSDGDNEQGQPVALLSAEAADKLVGVGISPIGRQVSVGRLAMPNSPRTATVVGVIGDIRYAGLAAPPDGAVYVPFAQRPLRHLFIAVVGDGDPLLIAQPVHRAITAIHPGLLVSDVRRLDEALGATLGYPKLRALIASSVSILAVVLSLFGVFALTAYSIASRTREIAVRIAIGAAPGRIVRSLVSASLRTATAGAMLGSIVAAAGAQAVSSLFFGTAPLQVPILGLVVLAQLLMTAIAAWIAGRRVFTMSVSSVLR